MTCAYVGCGNTARYIDEDGTLCCATCPLKAGKDSIRLSNVPDLLAWARRRLASPVRFDGTDAELRAIIGRNARGSE